MQKLQSLKCPKGMGLELGFRAQGLGFRVQGLGFRGLWFWAQGFGFTVQIFLVSRFVGKGKGPGGLFNGCKTLRFRVWSFEEKGSTKHCRFKACIPLKPRKPQQFGV